MSDLVRVDLTVRCGHVQLGPERILEIETWVGDGDEIAEQLAAWRMGWATIGRFL